MTTPSGLMQEPLSQTDAGAPSGSGPGKHQRSVLVFDTNPLHRLLLTRMFARCGCVAETAESAGALLAACQQSAFALMLIDCDCPNLDVFQILAELRNRSAGSSAPIIALTSSVSQADRRRRRAAGFDNYLEKPARLDKVQALMARYAPNTATGNSQLITSVDLGRLAETVELAGSDPAAVREIFAVFLTTTPRMLDDMRRAEEESSPEALSRAAIALKTASSAMGLRRIEEICGLIRALAESRVITGVGALMGELSLAFERASCDLRSAEIELLAQLTTGSGGSAEAQRRSGPGRVLLAEHDRLIAKFISASLKSSGLEVICVNDGAAALAAASEKTPDVMLLSASLPNIDGFQLLSRLRLEKTFRSTPVIILSQRHQEADVLRSFELGADDFMSQPLNPLEVAARTQRLLRKR